jgi:hypothetical protein
VVDLRLCMRVCACVSSKCCFFKYLANDASYGKNDCRFEQTKSLRGTERDLTMMMAVAIFQDGDSITGSGRGNAFLRRPSDFSSDADTESEQGLYIYFIVTCSRCTIVCNCWPLRVRRVKGRVHQPSISVTDPFSLCLNMESPIVSIWKMDQ